MHAAPAPLRPSILIVIDTRIIGGSGRVIFHFLDTALPDKFTYTLCSFRHRSAGSREFSEEIIRRGYQAEEIPQAGLLDPRPIWYIGRMLASGSYNILETHGYKGHFIAWLLTWFFRLPWIAFCHGWTNENRKMRLYKLLDLFTLRRADVVICVSETIATELATRSKLRRSPNTIENAINTAALDKLSGGAALRETLGIAKGTCVLGCFGRLSPEKGQSLLINALKHLERDDVMVLFAGEGPDRIALEDLAKEANLISRVRFAGYQSDLAPYFDAIDCLVIPSLSEGLPNVLLEAMAYGKLVVSTPVGAIPSVIEHNETGFLSSGASVEGLLEALRCYFSTAERHETMVAAAQQKVEHQFSARSRSERILELYGNVLSN